MREQWHLPKLDRGRVLDGHTRDYVGNAPHCGSLIPSRNFSDIQTPSFLDRAHLIVVSFGLYQTAVTDILISGPV